ncbi:TolC family protein [bacterium]|nr:TolC family protein [bacterium]
MREQLAMAALVSLAGCSIGDLPAQEREIGVERRRLGRSYADDDPIEAILAAKPEGGDAEARITSGISTDQVQEIAVRRNPELTVALERWVAFLERVPQRQFPSISPAFSYRYSGQMKTHEVGVDVGVPFPTKLVTEARAALSEARATGADYRERENILRMEAATAYASLYLARREVEIVDENVVLLGRFIEILDARVKAGRATLSDMLRARVERDGLRAERATLAGNVLVATSALNVLLDRHPDAPIGKLAALPLPEGPGELTALYERALERRPDLVATEHRVAAADEATSRARQEWIPDPTFGASYVRDFGTDRSFAGFMGGFSLPIYVPSILARIRESEALARGARAEVRSTRNRVLDDVRASAARTAAAAERYAILAKDALPEAETGVRTAEGDYVAGTVDFLALLDAERTLLAKSLDRERAHADYASRRAELDRAIGGRR